MINLTYGLQIPYTDTRLALIHFSDPELTAVDFRFNSPYSTNPNMIAEYIRHHMDFEGGNTALFTALNLAYTDVMSTDSGARTDQYDKTVAAYAIIITDGVATDGGNLPYLAYQMAQSGIAIYAVGIGSLFAENENYLYELTYDYNRIYNVSDFTKLDEELVERLLNDTCCPLNFTRPPPMPTPEYCDIVDLIFVLDEAETVIQTDKNNFETLKEYLINLTDIFTVSRQNTHVAIVGYGRKTTVHLHYLDALDKYELRNRIGAIDFLGGARNVSGGLDEAREEILRNSRLGINVPVYMVHVVEYAQDIRGDPLAAADELGKLGQPGTVGVTMYAAAIENFQFDSIFVGETAGIVSRVGHGSKVYNVSSYPGLFTSPIREDFLNLLRRDFPCPTTVASPVSKHPIPNRDEENDG